MKTFTRKSIKSLKANSHKPILPILQVQLIITFTLCVGLSLGFSSCVNLLPEETERNMGISNFNKMKSSKKISRNPRMNAMIQRVGRRLAPVANREMGKNNNWEFIVFEDSSANAFALPGGKVGVHSGLFPVAKNDAGLAAIVGHEIAHVILRHGGQSVTRSMLLQLGGIALSQTGVGAVAQNAALLGGSLLYDKPFSRKHESDADKYGAIIMAKAGYHPAESVEMWKRFAVHNKKSGKGKNLAFLSTHPLDQDRISKLQAFLPEAMSHYRTGSSSMPSSNLAQQNRRKFAPNYRARLYNQ